MECVSGEGMSCECGGVSDECIGDTMCDRGDWDVIGAVARGGWWCIGKGDSMVVEVGFV